MAGIVDLARLLSGQDLEEARKTIESGEAEFKVYALPRPRLKIRTPKKKLVELEEGKIARLEYSLVRASISAALEGRKPSFKDVATLAGDYKAAAAYLAFLWRTGLVVFDNQEAATNLYIASSALSQKTYEHRISKILDATFSINVEKVATLPSDTVFCVYREGALGCKYIVANCARSQAKAEIRGVIDALLKK